MKSGRSPLYLCIRRVIKHNVVIIETSNFCHLHMRRC